MKTNHRHRQRVCPRCGMTYSDPPARSREDNETQICPDCGTREALVTLDVSKEEQDSIIAAIHHHRQGN